jgi:hypothetical protein
VVTTVGGILSSFLAMPTVGVFEAQTAASNSMGLQILLVFYVFPVPTISYSLLPRVLNFHLELKVITGSVGSWKWMALPPHSRRRVCCE